jgi:hypothetical protein
MSERLGVGWVVTLAWTGMTLDAMVSELLTLRLATRLGLLVLDRLHITASVMS